MKHFWLLGFCLFFSIFGFSSIEDHLKPVPDKSNIHSMKNIDFIYMINLDERPEKFEVSSEQLYHYSVFPYRFSAVNGWKLPLETINDVGVEFKSSMRGGFMGTSYHTLEKATHGKINNPGQVYFCHCMSRGAVGIVLSHLSILQDAIDSGYETIWVMEDDIEIKKNPHLLSEMIEKLDRLVGKNGWDILFTDRDTRNNAGKYVPCTAAALRPNFSPPRQNSYAFRRNISPDFRKIGARYGAYSMILRRSGMIKMVNFLKTHKIFLPYDMEYTLPIGIRLFTVLDDIVSTRIGSPSDNGQQGYLKNIKE